MSGVSVLSPYNNLYAKQSRKGCLRTLCGCDAQTEFTVATKEAREHDIFHVQEQSDCCMRTFCAPIHPFIMTMSMMNNRDSKVAVYERPCNLPAQNCKCCCYQTLIVRDGSTNVEIGKIEETFYFCNPQYSVKNASGEVIHHIHVPNCLGCCPNICAEGCCQVPFYIYPGSEPTDKEHGKIIKIWGSLRTEMMGVHQFECDFPPNANADEKALFMGATYMLNELYFKPKSNQNN